jgi:hypothetical protein
MPPQRDEVSGGHGALEGSEARSPAPEILRVLELRSLRAVYLDAGPGLGSAATNHSTSIRVMLGEYRIAPVPVHEG